MIRSALPLLLLATPAAAQLSERELATAVARPPTGARLPADMALVDGSGRRVTLGQVAGGRPLVLLFADYTCPHVCGPGLVLTASALRDSGARGYAFAAIGLDPRDTAADAQRFARAARPRPILLRGDQPTIDRAAEALGYHYLYDRSGDQFAHDASVYVFAADGRLAALLPELALRPEALGAALAGAARPERWTERVARLCYGLAAAHGRYGRATLLSLQLVSAGMIAALAALLWRRRRPA